MSPSQAQRLAPLSGVAFFVLALVSALVFYPGDGPEFVDEPAAISAFYADHDDELLAPAILYLLSGVFLMWFVGTLRARLRQAEGSSGRLSATAFGGGVATVALLWAASSIDLLAALRVQEQGAIEAQVATVYWDLSSALFGIAAPYGMAVLLGASAVVGLRFGALPDWLAWSGALVAFACLIAPIAFLAIIVSFVWVAIAGVVLYMEGSAASAQRVS